MIRKSKKQSEKKLECLVREVERRMSVCNMCFDDDFLKKRPELYVAALEEAQKELGIEVDFEKQRENILGKKQGDEKLNRPGVLENL